MTRTNCFRLLHSLLTLFVLSTFGLHSARAQIGEKFDPAVSVKDSLDSPFAAFRLGVIASPSASIDGGLDVTFPRLSIRKAWVSRLDIDIAARFNSRSFGSRRDASVGVTLCQVYTPGGVNRGRWYGGAGIGYFIGPQSGAGGKVFVGTNFSRVISMEVEGQLPGDSTARLVFMLRLSAL